jgi:ribosomal protein S18 acetylase RimI-like enzyme
VDFNIRKARPDDVLSLVALNARIGRYYGDADTESRDEASRRTSTALFAEGASAVAIVAWTVENSSRAVGLAAYSYLWPAIGSTESLFLKELFVDEEFRRRGLARRLLIDVFTAAIERQCSRVEWTADRGNAPAEKLYEGLGFGGNIHEGKWHYRVDAEDMKRARVRLDRN